LYYGPSSIGISLGHAFGPWKVLGLKTILDREKLDLGMVCIT